MEKLEVLQQVLIYDKVLRFSIDLLMGIKGELKADIEETKVLADSLLTPEERDKVRDFLSFVESDFVPSVEEALDSVYSDYEVFNFDITFLSNVPEELKREIERLELINSINKKLNLLKEKLDITIDELSKESECIKAIVTSFSIYRDLIEHTLQFNEKFEKVHEK